MADDLKDIISKAPAGAEVVLPAGEFEGPLVVSKPLRIIGKNTTIWAKTGSVIEIKSKGVSIENVRAELTEGTAEDAAAVSEYPCEVRNVEVLGRVSGFGAEDGYFDVPRTIELGEFLAEEENTFCLSVNVPDKTEIICDMREVRFSPSVLSAGRNDVVITVGGISAQTFLYAELIFKTRFLRRIYLFGKPRANAEKAENKTVYEAPERDFSQVPEAVSQKASVRFEETESDVVSMSNAADSTLPALSMTRGQRVSLTQYLGTHFDIFFTCRKPTGMEIDPYIFLLDKDELSLGDEGLVFFGNTRSQSGEAEYFPNDGHIAVDLAKTDYRVQKIALAYSIYAGGANNNFSSVGSPRISITTESGERVSFEMSGLSGETTVVALEFYIYKGEWKISAVGAGFRDGMAKLCNRYGIEVEE